MAASHSVSGRGVRSEHSPAVAQPLGNNPFASVVARAHSSYVALHNDTLIHALDPGRAPSPLTEFVHESFRSLVLNPRFSCVAAKSAFRHQTYRMGVYGEMGSPEATTGLAHDLWAFVQEQPTLGSDFTTFVASFTGPIAVTERDFERQLWTQLQRLHDLDADHHGWDPTVSANPDDADFGYSFAGRAFFVIGLHPASSRWTRRFAWPTLVFNAHHQFERLREQGKFTRMRDVIRTREHTLQGDVNAMLTDFGERSEARQYAGRAVSDEWRCPFHAHINGADAAPTDQQAE